MQEMPIELKTKGLTFGSSNGSVQFEVDKLGRRGSLMGSMVR